MEKIKVILVDNDPDEIFFMVKGFKSARLFEVIGQVSGGNELMEFLDNSDQLPDLIITDLNMPGKSGVDIANEILKNPRYTSTKVIIMSIMAEKHFDTKYLNTHSYTFVQKPASLLEYRTFAKELYSKIRADVI